MAIALAVAGGALGCGDGNAAAQDAAGGKAGAPAHSGGSGAIGDQQANASSGKSSESTAGAGGAPALPSTASGMAGTGETDPATCAQSGLELPIPKDWNVTAMATTAVAGEALVLYSLQSTIDEGASVQLMLARLGAAEAPIGVAPLADPLVIAELEPSVNTPQLALASDGSSTVACWARAGRVNCSALEGSSGVAKELVAQDGRSVAVAHGGLGWLVAYGSYSTVSAPADFVLTRYSDDLEVAGAPGRLRFAAESSMYDAQPLLAATASDFVLVAPSPDNSNMEQLYRLNAELQPVAEPIDLGASFWFWGSLAANEEQAVVSLAKPYGGSLLALDAFGVVSRGALSGGVKLGVAAGTTVGDAGPWAGWLDASGTDLHLQPLQTQDAFGSEPFAAAPATLALLPVSGRLVILYPTVSGEPVAFPDRTRASGLAIRCMPRPLPSGDCVSHGGALTCPLAP